MSEETMADPSVWLTKFFQILFRNAPDGAVTETLLRECLESLPHALTVVPNVHAPSPETVTVPRSLLRQVLDDAEATADGVRDAARWARHAKAEVAMKPVRARIAELRRAAGTRC